VGLKLIFAMQVVHFAENPKKVWREGKNQQKMQNKPGFLCFLHGLRNLYSVMGYYASVSKLQ